MRQYSNSAFSAWAVVISAIGFPLGAALFIWQRSEWVTSQIFKDHVLLLDEEVETLQTVNPEVLNTASDTQATTQDWVWGMPLDWNDVQRVAFSIIGLLALVNVARPTGELITMMLAPSDKFVNFLIGEATPMNIFVRAVPLLLQIWLGFILLTDAPRLVNYLNRIWKRKQSELDTNEMPV